MKKFRLIILPLFFASLLYFAINAANSNNLVIEKTKTDKQTMKDVTAKPKKDTKAKPTMFNGHDKSSIDCKTCHLCEYPTKNDPCLNPCPRKEMVSIHHSPDEGPIVVHMNDIDGDYGDVVFSHKLHAEMSGMSGGCSSCHHYNTTGPVLKCKTCHSKSRVRDDMSVPDLEAAYHRQCLNCHRQWSRSTDCKSCHIPKKEEAKLLAKKMEIEHAKRKHPNMHRPLRVTFETNYEKGKIVTFFHDEHTNMFGAACTSCHKDDNCIKCHDVKMGFLRNSEHPTIDKKISKTFDEHHQPCITCHKNESCDKCHKTEPMTPFSHVEKTGFDLNEYHATLKCNKCHLQEGNFKGLNKNCTSCHSNFAAGKFDHKRVGLVLSDNHSELDCSDCHKENKFAQKPSCVDCHDDKSYPAQKPGKIVTKSKK